MKVRQEHPENDVVDNDLILVWGEENARRFKSEVQQGSIDGMAE